MSRRRSKLRIDGQPDGRSNPRLKPCPPEQQRYILRKCTKDGFPLVGEGLEGKYPPKKEIARYLKGNGYNSGTFVLLLTRPRPQHVATFKFQPIKNIYGKWVNALVQID